MANIIIDEEFKGLLPALDGATYAALEENLLQNGCRDALVLWGDILIDGHNRYAICTEHGIPFETVSKEFDSREDALIWIVSTQIARRNLTPMQLSHYRGLHYRAERKIITNVRGNNQHSEVGGHSDPQPPLNKTANKLADRYNVSPKTINRDAKVSESIEAIGKTSSEAKRMILSGEAKVDKKFLRELTDMSTENISLISASIEDGTFEKRKSEFARPARPAANAAPAIQTGAFDALSADPGIPSAVPGAQSVVPGIPSAVPGALSGATSADPGAPSAIPGIPSAVPGAPSAVHIADPANDVSLVAAIDRVSAAFNVDLRGLYSGSSAADIRANLRSFIDTLEKILGA